MESGLSASVVLITGASKGIGLACAEAFAREGATVVGISRSTANLEAAKAQLAAQGLVMTVYKADLVNPAAAQRAIERIESDIGPIAVLVNNAGAARRFALDELGNEAFQSALDAKYFTYMNVMEPVIRRMAVRRQ
jgi:NAD(P)-dependent dehydrogenase (short-subunit alcohol dehydrogenase family)